MDALLTVRLLRQADRVSRRFEDHRGPEGGEVDGARMARGNVAEIAGRNVQYAVHEGGELEGRRVKREEPVQEVGDLRRPRNVEPVEDVAIADQDRGWLGRW